METVTHLVEETSIFVKYWNLFFLRPTWELSPLPGKNEGVSGSSIGGTNIGINKYISDEHKRAAAQVVEFITSMETQKKIVMMSGDFSGIESIYNDPEVCALYDCELIKSIQPIGRFNSLTNSYEYYSQKFNKYFYEYLYEKECPEETLKKLNELSYYNHITLKNSNYSVGLIIFLITTLSIILIVASVSALFLEKSKNRFYFMTIDSWLWMLGGFVLCLCSIYMEYGEVKIRKCILQLFFWNIGFSLVYVPILYQLISIFPYDHPLLRVFSKLELKYMFFTLFLLFDILLNLVFYIASTFDVKIVDMSEGDQYKMCYLSKSLGKTIQFILYLEKGLILLAISILLFLEWNIRRTSSDMKTIFASVVIALLLFSPFALFYEGHFNNKIDFCIKSTVVILEVASSYALLYLVRLVSSAFSEDYEKKLVAKFITDSGTKSTNAYSDKSCKQEKIIRKKNNLISIIISFHSFTGEESSSAQFENKSSIQIDNNKVKSQINDDSVNDII